VEIKQVGGLLVKVLGFVTRGKLLKLSVPVRIIICRICPNLSQKIPENEG
jgi:hypothetical protein